MKNLSLKVYEAIVAYFIKFTWKDLITTFAKVMMLLFIVTIIQVLVMGGIDTWYEKLLRALITIGLYYSDFKITTYKINS